MYWQNIFFNQRSPPPHHNTIRKNQLIRKKLSSRSLPSCQYSQPKTWHVYVGKDQKAMMRIYGSKPHQYIKLWSLIRIWVFFHYGSRLGFADEPGWSREEEISCCSSPFSLIHSTLFPSLPKLSRPLLQRTNLKIQKSYYTSHLIHMKKRFYSVICFYFHLAMGDWDEN